MLALWKNTLHFFVHLCGPHSLLVFPLCTICPQCWPQAQLWLLMLSLRFHAQRYSCPEDRAPVSLPQDNTSCPGGGRGMTEPCFLGPHSHVSPQCSLCSGQSTKAPLWGIQTLQQRARKPNRLLCLALLLFSEKM